MFKHAFLVVCLGVCASAGAAQSDKPAFGGDFTFRKIKPPAPGTQRRITIQIEPEADRPKATEPEKTTATPSPDMTDWFWARISSGLDANGTERFQDAVEFLGGAEQASALNTPRLEDLRSIAAAYGAEILLNTVETRVSPALVLALISVESSGRSNAESEKGAQGLMQLIPATAERFGVEDPNDPRQNLKGGITYLSWLLDEFDGDPILALAGYNAGENAVKSHEGVPPFSETRAYVPKVLAAWRVAQALCMTPPVLPSDPCVFRTEG